MALDWMEVLDAGGLRPPAGIALRAAAVLELAGGGPPPRHLPPRPGDVPHSRADLAAAAGIEGGVKGAIRVDRRQPTSEPGAWETAAASMYVPHDDARGITPQDESFLDRDRPGRRRRTVSP